MGKYQGTKEKKKKASKWRQQEPPLHVPITFACQLWCIRGQTDTSCTAAFLPPHSYPSLSLQFMKWKLSSSLLLSNILGMVMASSL
jgi:hypothetical protein